MILPSCPLANIAALDMIFTRKVYTDLSTRQSLDLKTVTVSDIKEIQVSLREGFTTAAPEDRMRDEIEKILDNAILGIESLK